MGYTSIDGAVAGAGAAPFAEVWDSGDLTALTHDFVASGAVDVAGVTITPENTANAATFVLGGSGLAIENNKATNWDTATDTGPGFHLDRGDLGIDEFTDWCWQVDWAVTGGTTSGYKYAMVGVKYPDAGTLHAQGALVGYETSVARTAIKQISNGATNVFAASTAAYAQMRAHLRVYVINGRLIVMGSTDGVTWVFGGAGGGPLPPSVTWRPTMRQYASAWVAFQNQITRMRVFTRPNGLAIA